MRQRATGIVVLGGADSGPARVDQAPGSANRGGRLPCSWTGQRHRRLPGRRAENSKRASPAEESKPTSTDTSADAPSGGKRVDCGSACSVTSTTSSQTRLNTPTWERVVEQHPHANLHFVGADQGQEGLCRGQRALHPRLGEILGRIEQLQRPGTGSPDHFRNLLQRLPVRPHVAVEVMHVRVQGRAARSQVELQAVLPVCGAGDADKARKYVRQDQGVVIAVVAEVSHAHGGRRHVQRCLQVRIQAPAVVIIVAEAACGTSFHRDRAELEPCHPAEAQAGREAQAIIQGGWRHRVPGRAGDAAQFAVELDAGGAEGQRLARMCAEEQCRRRRQYRGAPQTGGAVRSRVPGQHQVTQPLVEVRAQLAVCAVLNWAIDLSHDAICT